MSPRPRQPHLIRSFHVADHEHPAAGDEERGPAGNQREVAGTRLHRLMGERPVIGAAVELDHALGDDL